MKNKDLIHKITPENIPLDAEVIFKNLKDNTEFKISAVGYDKERNTIIFNNLYDL